MHNEQALEEQKKAYMESIGQEYTPPAYAPLNTDPNRTPEQRLQEQVEIAMRPQGWDDNPEQARIRAEQEQYGSLVGLSQALNGGGGKPTNRQKDAIRERDAANELALRKAGIAGSAGGGGSDLKLPDWTNNAGSSTPPVAQLALHKRAPRTAPPAALSQALRGGTSNG